MRKQSLFLASLLTGCLAPVFPTLSDEIVNVEQGWSPADKTAWYTTTQGSRLLPLSWLRALEQPDSDKPFLAPEYMAAFHYLPGPGASDLPIGFAIDAQDDSQLSATKLRWKERQSSKEPWAGMTCSACHSNEITYNGMRMRVEGAPTLADFQSFQAALYKALDQTWLDDQKFARFAKKVLGDDDQDSDKLRGELAKLVDVQTRLAASNATPLRYGFGRLDAIGNILNKVATIVNAPAQTFHASDAPVSYPFLWNIHQLSAVQWNASVSNGPVVGGVDLGALGRNSGEVVGVFGDVQIELWPLALLRPGYKSSINMANLDQLEQLVRRLKPPAWPSVFPAIDETRRLAGQRLFAERCEKCHAHLDRDDLTTHIDVGTTLLKGPERIGTDPWMACNAYANSARTGFMIGAPKGYLVLPGEKPIILGSTAPEFDMLSTAVIGSIVGYAGKYKNLVNKVVAKELYDRKSSPHIDLAPQIKLSNLVPEIAPATVDPDKIAQLKRCLADDSPILGYKFRPLSGIWATAPYLHNGSVPTLYDLLLPPSDRPKSFYVGTREFDPVKVGFKTEQSAENSFLFRVFDDQGTPIQGNLNSGHDYNNAGLSEADRAALVEYMKGL
ncbi:MAG: di-heme-cytochrome C peroxidase [Pseudomonadota bacterium]|nr:di-heme-cytochrome C peroxidase [Pseudomonadota bacterium]